jgi:hypothetical protein
MDQNSFKWMNQTSKINSFVGKQNKMDILKGDINGF